MNIEVSYLEDSNVTQQEYEKFLEVYHGKNWPRYIKRAEWYRKNPVAEDNYRVVVAKLDGQLIGQTCAFRTTVVVKGQEKEFWWSVDTFVLSAARGKGIGTKLARKLHEECPNFSSAFYSPTNGHVKRKLGATELFQSYTAFYPTSRFCTLYLCAVLQKLLKRRVNCIIRIPYIYSFINRRSLKNYKIEETSIVDSTIIKFIDECIRENNYDFYVKRDADYLFWKYKDNPGVKYHLLKIINNQKLVAVLSFTDKTKLNVAAQKAVGIKMLDFFLLPDSGLRFKDMFQIISDFCRKNHLKIDGILSVKKVNYFPRIIYPFKGSPLLSMMKGVSISNPYLSRMDQDGEQMDF